MVINNQTHSLETAAQGFAAIGAGPRLAVLKKLVRIGPKGLQVGELQQSMDIPPSTLAHHLRVLAEAGLILQTKNGRHIINAPNFPAITALIDFLISECCIEMDGTQFVCHEPENQNMGEA